MRRRKPRTFFRERGLTETVSARGVARCKSSIVADNGECVGGRLMPCHCPAGARGPPVVPSTSGAYPKTEAGESGSPGGGEDRWCPPPRPACLVRRDLKGIRKENVKPPGWLPRRFPSGIRAKRPDPGKTEAPEAIRDEYRSDERFPGKPLGAESRRPSSRDIPSGLSGIPGKPPTCRPKGGSGGKI